MEAVKLTVGQLETNCYLVSDEESQDAIIVDPGDDGDFIIQKVLDARLHILAIVATHGHFDHVLAVNELKLAFDVPFWMHRKDEFLLERMRESTQHFAGFDPGPPPKVDEYFDGEKRVEFGSLYFDVFETPGHTPGSVSLHARESNTLLVGDVLFADGGVGRTDFSYCSSSKLHKSIAGLMMLPDQTMIYPGHGGEFYLADERLIHAR